MNLSQLVTADLPPIDWAVKGLIKPGCNVVAAKPKVGKSGWNMQLAICVSSGIEFLGYEVTRKGDVIYIGYEDDLQDLQSRARLQIGKLAVPASKRLEIYTDWPKANQGGIDQLKEVIRDYDGALRQVIIDDLRHFSPLVRSYNRDNEVIESIDTLGRRNNVAIVVILHQGRGSSSNDKNWDWMDRIQGSGTGAARVIIGLERDQSSPTGVMRVTGKGVKDTTQALTYDGASGMWSLAASDDPELDALTRAQAELYPDVARLPGLTAPKLAQRTGRDYDSLRLMLRRMVEAGTILRVDNRFYIAGTSRASASDDGSSPRQTTIGDVIPVDGTTVQIAAVESSDDECELPLKDPDPLLASWMRARGMEDV